MRHQVVAQRYADALFDLAKGQGTLDQVDGDLAGLVSVMHDHPDLATIWNSPIVSTEDKKATLRQLFEGKIDAMVLNTLLLMFDNKRGETVGALQEAFRDRFNDHRKRTQVKVKAAMPLDEREERELQEQLAKTTGREIRMQVAIDPELIGGMVVTIGDQVIDNSLKGRLEALAHTLA